jgi:hypothetical protein
MPPGAQTFHGSIQRPLLDVSQYHGRSCRRERGRESEADAARRAGHDGDPPFDSVHVNLCGQ